MPAVSDGQLSLDWQAFEALDVPVKVIRAGDQQFIRVDPPTHTHIPRRPPAIRRPGPGCGCSPIPRRTFAGPPPRRFPTSRASLSTRSPAGSAPTATASTSTAKAAMSHSLQWRADIADHIQSLDSAETGAAALLEAEGFERTNIQLALPLAAARDPHV